MGVTTSSAERLDARVITLWRRYCLVALGGALLVVVGIAVAGFLAGESVAAPVGVGLAPVVVAALVAVWWPPRRYKHWSYALGPDALELQHGAVIRRRSVIPYFRVQHVDTSRGPLERGLGLARLKVHTASSGTDATIPGLGEDLAAALRSAIVARAGHSAGV